ncbi:hypothetical protein QC764_202198 [Podospora pseudoanserina]|uniref:Uncharacterized protein n=1 Tax=Podospora pseudoanserina TaxID=2609844 RepID=A0ABR0IGG6_9PEZI|nr:hypothetical protein QC764_202198 [Podospora pseudoanserina]
MAMLTTSICLSHHPSTSLDHLTFSLTQTQPNNSDPHSQHPFSPTTVTNPPTQQNERRTRPLPPPNLRLQDHPLRPSLPDPRFLSALGSRPARRVRAPEHRMAGPHHLLPLLHLIQVLPHPQTPPLQLPPRKRKMGRSPRHQRLPPSLRHLWRQGRC